VNRVGHTVVIVPEELFAISNEAATKAVNQEDPAPPIKDGTVREMRDVLWSLLHSENCRIVRIT
jgi:hypothetical protein